MDGKYPMYSFKSAEKHLGLYVKCPLLVSDFESYRNVSTNFSKTCEYKFSLKFVIPFSSYYMIARRDKTIWMDEKAPKTSK